MRYKLHLLYIPLIFIGVLFLNEDESFNGEIDHKSIFLSVDDSKRTMFDQWIRTGINTQGVMRLKDSSNDPREF